MPSVFPVDGGEIFHPTLKKHVLCILFICVRYCGSGGFFLGGGTCTKFKTLKDKYNHD